MSTLSIRLAQTGSDAAKAYVAEHGWSAAASHMSSFRSGGAYRSGWLSALTVLA